MDFIGPVEFSIGVMPPPLLIDLTKLCKQTVEMFEYTKSRSLLHAGDGFSGQ
jgi:hypothetical protein